MIARKCFAPVALAAALAALVGCSKGSGPSATVAGVITHNGTPVDGARVEFHNTTEGAGGKRDVFASTTDSSGKYMITSVAGVPVQPGMYKVVVTKYDTKGNPNAGKEGFDAGQLEAQISDGQGTGQAGIKNALPKEYSSFATTKLSATVQEGKNEGVNFDLKGK